MLDTETCEEVARSLAEVRTTRQPLDLLTKTLPDISLDDAYRIQDFFVKGRIAAGHPVRGYKVGQTSPESQELTSAKEPSYSAITDDMIACDEAELSHKDFFFPMVEAEIAFVMKDQVAGPGIQPSDVMLATDYLLPAIEIVDFRVGPAPGMTVVDMVADLSACGGAVLGAVPRSVDRVNLESIHTEVFLNGDAVAQGVSSTVLGNPLASVTWLANKLAERGTAIEPGNVILTGTLVSPTPVKRGDEIIARYDQGLDEVAVCFL